MLFHHQLEDSGSADALADLSVSSGKSGRGNARHRSIRRTREPRSVSRTESPSGIPIRLHQDQKGPVQDEILPYEIDLWRPEFRQQIPSTATSKRTPGCNAGDSRTLADPRTTGNVCSPAAKLRRFRAAAGKDVPHPDEIRPGTCKEYVSKGSVAKSSAKPSVEQSGPAAHLPSGKTDHPTRALASCRLLGSSGGSSSSASALPERREQQQRMDLLPSGSLPSPGPSSGRSIRQLSTVQIRPEKDPTIPQPKSKEVSQKPRPDLMDFKRFDSFGSYYRWLASGGSSSGMNLHQQPIYFATTGQQQPVSLPDSVNSPVVGDQKEHKSRSFRRSKSSSRMSLSSHPSSSSQRGRKDQQQQEQQQHQLDRSSLIPSSSSGNSGGHHHNNNKAVTFHAFATVQLVD